MKSSYKPESARGVTHRVPRGAVSELSSSHIYQLVTATAFKNEKKKEILLCDLTNTLLLPIVGSYNAQKTSAAAVLRISFKRLNMSLSIPSRL